MSTGFPFGQKPNETPTFGQASFAAPQFNTAAATPVQSQFSSPFGGKPAAGGFQFSTPTTTPAFGASFNFNATNAQPNANPTPGSFGFNTATTAAPTFSLPTPSTGFAFSTPSSVPQTTTLFGTAAPTPGLSLGTKTTAPTFGAPSGGLFGTIPSTASATPTTNFGMAVPMSASTGLTFGTPQSTAPKMTYGSSTPGGFSFGPTTTSAGPSSGLSFGAVALSPQAQKLPFGPTTSAAPAVNFGAMQSTPATNLSFQPVSTSVPQTSMFPTSVSTAPQMGLGFGTPASTAPTLAMNYGTQASSAPKTGVSFTAAPTTFGTLTAPPTGVTFSAVSSAPSTNLNFMAPTSTVPSLGLPSSVAAAVTTAGFLSTTSAAPTTTVGFSGVTSTPGTTVSNAPTLSFMGASAPTVNFGGAAITSAPPLSFGATLQTTAPVLSSTGGVTSFGLGGIKPVATTAPLTGFPTPSHSLGGVPKTTDVSTTKQSTTDQSKVAPKDQLLPNELMQTVEGFKKFVKEQKGYSSEIGRFSIKDLRKVENDVDLINNCMNEVENQLRKNKAMADKLKIDTARDLQHAEMAQRTFDTPAGLQYENTAPFNYFVELSDNFETEMHDLKIHIENVAKYIRNSGAPTTLSPEDLALGMRRLHESFVALAGRLQSVHSQVEVQKEQYLSIRKKVLNDYTNVFEKQSKESDALEMLLEKLVKQQPAISNSPTPFTSLRSSQVQAVGQNNTTSGYPTVTTLGPTVSTGFSIGGSPNMSLFGTNTTSTPSIFNTSASNSFQLQKPPVGNKRGKP